jgi:hypothetical protein
MKLVLAASLLALVAAPTTVAPAPPLATPRAAHSATLLGSGEVLIAGGCTVDGCEQDARSAETELFDPEAGRFRAGPRMSRPRVGHLAIRLPGGRVLIAGGWTGSTPTATTEVYDPVRNDFSVGPRMTTPRGGAAVAPLGRGRFLFIGGENGNQVLASAEIFDSARMRFTRTGGMRVPRAAHSATMLSGGRVLVAGGFDAQDIVLGSTEIYVPRTGRFSKGPPMAVNRHKHAAVRLRDGSVLLVGGSNGRDFFGRYASAERLAPGARRFRLVGSMAERRFKLPDAVVRLPSGRVLVTAGGPHVEAYDPRTRRFGRVGRTGVTLSFATATVLADGRVLVAGGYDDRIRVSRSTWLIGP